jgi:hypothetical protein
MTIDETREDSQNPGRTEPARRPYFGRRLKELRETFLSRITVGGRENPLVRAPSTNRLVECLRSHGVSISTAAYNEIEQGFNVPRNAVPFLDGVAACLQLTEEDKRDLELRLAYDILWARLGELADRLIPQHTQWPTPPPGW